MTQPAGSSPLQSLLAYFNATDAFHIQADFDFANEIPFDPDLNIPTGYWRHVGGVNAGEVPLGNVATNFYELDGALFPDANNRQANNKALRVPEISAGTLPRQMVGGYSALDAIAIPLFNQVARRDTGELGTALRGFLVLGNQSQYLTVPRNPDGSLDYLAMDEFLLPYREFNELGEAPSGGIEPVLAELTPVNLGPRAELSREELEPHHWPVPENTRLQTSARIVQEESAKYSLDGTPADFVIIVDKNGAIAISSNSTEPEKLQEVLEAIQPALEERIAGKNYVQINEQTLNQQIDGNPGPFAALQNIDGHALLAARGLGRISRGTDEISWVILGNTTNKRGFSAGEIHLAHDVAYTFARRPNYLDEPLTHQRALSAAQGHLGEGKPLGVVELQAPSAHQHGTEMERENFDLYTAKVETLAQEQGGIVVRNPESLRAYFPGQSHTDVVTRTENFQANVAQTLRSITREPAVATAGQILTNIGELEPAGAELTASVTARAETMRPQVKPSRFVPRIASRLRQRWFGPKHVPASAIVVNETPPLQAPRRQSLHVPRQPGSGPAR
ncbi:MAG: hypothetical protein HOQ05_11670 [Corynebacteriales bacterium]|nr:hypothetical protein [Mycobacteriales bacterium]